MTIEFLSYIVRDVIAMVEFRSIFRRNTGHRTVVHKAACCVLQSAAYRDLTSCFFTISPPAVHYLCIR